MSNVTELRNWPTKDGNCPANTNFDPTKSRANDIAGVNMLNDGLGALVTILTGDEWDVLAMAETLRKKYPMKEVTFGSLKSAGDFVLYRHQILQAGDCANA